MNRGFIVSAQNSASGNYLECAEVLCRSIKSVMPDEKVTLLTDCPVNIPVFDNIVLYPYGDTCADSNWKLANDWQIYDASPYDYTIKIEADIYIPVSIDWWWDILKHRDLVVSTTIRKYTGEISNNMAYRKVFIDNNLPQTYNALTYFRKSDIAGKFFSIVKDIFTNWSEWREALHLPPKERATTDVVYGIAAVAVGVENCTLPNFTQMSMVHMKKMICDNFGEDWTKELLYEIGSDFLRIQTIPQLYPFHYQVKNFAKEIYTELWK